MEKNPHEQFMRRAIELSEYGSLKAKTGGVFGAVVVKNGKIIGEGYNQVVKNNDPTWHAEMQAIREACKTLGTPHLTGCVLYSSGESCPMCMAASYWACIEHIYYASTVEDAKTYGNFQDEDMYAEFKKDPQNRKIKVTQMLRDDAIAIWKKYAQLTDRVHY